MGKAKSIPDGYRTITPYITVRGAAHAIDFYKRLGARPDTGWQTYILQREHIERLINDDADDD